MSPLTALLSAVLVTVVASDDYHYPGIQLKHQYENYDIGQPPSGPQFHHFFGQGGFDPFGKSKASLHAYSGPHYDRGPIVGIPPISYSSQQFSYSHPQPSYSHPQPTYDLEGGHTEHHYAYAPQEEVYPVQMKGEKKGGPFAEIDTKLKGYANKFTKFMKDYIEYSDPQPQYQSSYYEPAEPAYYEEEEEKKSFTKKLKEGAEKVKSEFEKFGQKAVDNLKKMEEDATNKIKELFYKKEEPVYEPSYEYGPPSSYGAPQYYEEEKKEKESFTKKLKDGAEKVKAEFEKFGQKAIDDLKKMEEDATNKIKELFYKKEEEPVYAPSYEYGPPSSYGAPQYYEEQKKEKESFTKKLKEGAEKVKSEFEKFGQKAMADLKKMEEDATNKIKELFYKKEEEPVYAPSYEYGPPSSSYGAPQYYEEQKKEKESFTKKLSNELAKGMSKVKYEIEKIGEKAASELKKMEESATKKFKELSHVMEKVEGYVGQKIEEKIVKAEEKRKEWEVKLMPKLLKMEYKANKELEKIQYKAEKERQKFEAYATKKLKDIFEPTYEEYKPKGKGKGSLFKIFDFSDKDKGKGETYGYVEQQNYQLPLETYGPPAY